MREKLTLRTFAVVELPRYIAPPDVVAELPVIVASLMTVVPLVWLTQIPPPFLPDELLLMVVGELKSIG